MDTKKSKLASSEGEELYKVERLLDKRIENGKVSWHRFEIHVAC